MSNKTLPPELVSEMYTAIGESKLCEDAAEKCANIAIQYHNIQLPKVQNTLRLNQLSIADLHKQREELLSALIITNKRLFMALGEPEYNSFIDSNNKLLKKHEDGKE